MCSSKDVLLASFFAQIDFKVVQKQNSNINQSYGETIFIFVVGNSKCVEWMEKLIVLLPSCWFFSKISMLCLWIWLRVDEYEAQEYQSEHNWEIH